MKVGERFPGIASCRIGSGEGYPWFDDNADRVHSDASGSHPIMRQRYPWDTADKAILA